MFNNVTKTPQFASALIGGDTIKRGQNCTPCGLKLLPMLPKLLLSHPDNMTHADGRYRKAWNMIQFWGRGRQMPMQPMWKTVSFIDVGRAEKTQWRVRRQISFLVWAQQMVVGRIHFQHWHDVCKYTFTCRFHSMLILTIKPPPIGSYGAWAHESQSSRSISHYSRKLTTNDPNCIS